MYQIHTRASLTAGFLLCLLLLSSPVFSIPTNSTKLPTLGPSSTTTGTAFNGSTPTNLPEPPPNATSEINGMSVFWVIMPLVLACMIHPIGSACGLNVVYRHQIRIGPLMSLFDSLHLLCEIHHRYRNMGDGDGAISRIHSATREVVEMRLHRHQAREHDSGSNPQTSLQTSTLLCRLERCLYNTPIRHLFSAVLILQYAKLCGFHGIPMSFSLVTGYFASWIIMETVLLVGEGRAAMDPGGAALPTPDSSSLPIIRESAGSRAFLLQRITIIVGTFILIFTQDGSRFAPRHGETMLITYVRQVVLVNIPPFLLYWAEYTVLLAMQSHTSGHRSSTDRAGLLVATFCVSTITISAVSRHSWSMAALLPFFSCLMLFHAYRLFWPGGGGGAGPELLFSIPAFIYAGGSLLFYVSVFNPKGTWKAGWTECLP